MLLKGLVILCIMRGKLAPIFLAFQVVVRLIVLFMFLHLDQPFSFSFDYSSNQTRDYFFLREVFESEVIEETLLTVHLTVLSHLMILVYQLIEQLANTVLGMQLAVLLQIPIFRRS